MSMNDTHIVDFSCFIDKDIPLGSGPGELPDDYNTNTKKKKVNPINKKKNNNVEVLDGDIIEEKSINNYKDTMNALKNTVVELDILANDMKSDLDQVRGSRTLKGRYQYSSMLGQNIAQILSTKVQAIKEMNSTIKNAVELDYKIRKDNQAINNANDDQTLMNMYNAFISSPVSGGRDALGPSSQQLMLPNTNIQYTSIPNGPIEDNNMPIDVGYNNYINNLSPENKRMIAESNPDIKEVVIFNESTGEKHFKVMNTKTGDILEDIAHHDDIFLEDCSINKRNKIVRNTNLNESYPLVIINGNDKNIKNGF